jgi:malate dehydrogenase (oxaloacetate-decarboxylating)(NADP+)
MDSGVATRPVADFNAYRQSLTQFVYHSGTLMKPVFSAAKKAPRRVLYCEGEDERVLRAVQAVVDEGIARPVLLGRPAVVEARLQKLGLRIQPGRDFELISVEHDERYRELTHDYYRLMQRDGISPGIAKKEVLRSNTLIGALLLKRGDVDAMLCGTYGQLPRHLERVSNVIGLKPGARIFAAMNVLMLPRHTLFLCDTYINEDPTAGEIAEMTLMAAEEVRRFGIAPKVALLSYSNFGSRKTASALKMREARRLIAERAPQLEVDGEMHGDAALSVEIRNKVFPDAVLKGEANLLIMPNLDAANIAFNLLKVTGGDGITVGPILLGAAKPVHILTSTATVRRLVNMTALAVVDANHLRG